MGDHDFGRQFSRHAEQLWGQHKSGWAGNWQGGEGGGGGWGGWDGPGGRRGRQGPPPWIAELFGLAQGQQRRGPKVRRQVLCFDPSILGLDRRALDDAEQLPHVAWPVVVAKKAHRERRTGQSIGSVTPPRANVTLTFEPGVPVRRPDTPSSLRPFVAIPFTDTM